MAIPRAFTYVTTYIDYLLSQKLDKTARGAANGVASLDATGKVPSSQISGTGGGTVSGVSSVIFGGSGHTGDVSLTATAIGADAAGAATAAAGSAQTAAITAAQTYADRYAGSAAGTAGRPLAATDGSVTNRRAPSAALVKAPRIITAAGSAVTILQPSAANPDTIRAKLSTSSCAFSLPTGMKDPDAPTLDAAVDIVIWMEQGSDIGGRDFTLAGGGTMHYFGGTKPSLTGQAVNTMTPIACSTIDGGTNWYVTGVASGGTGGSGVSALTRTVKTGAYTAALGDNVSADTTGGTFDIALPSAAGGKGRIVIGWDAGTAAPRITLTGTDKFNSTSATPITPTVLGRRYQLESDGAGIWTATSGFIPTSEIVMQTLAGAKGDMLSASGPGVFVATPVGTNGKVWTADSTATGGASWQAPTAGAPAVVAGQLLGEVDYHPTTTQADGTIATTTLTDLAAAALAAITTNNITIQFTTTTAFTVTSGTIAAGDVGKGIAGTAIGAGAVIATFVDTTHGTISGATYTGTLGTAVTATVTTTAAWSSATTTMFDVTVTVPSTGKVTARSYVYVKGSASGVGIKLATYNVTAAALVVPSTITVLNGTAQQRATYEKTITGLTPGSTVTFRLQWGLAGAGTGTISVGGTSGPVRFGIFAA